MDAQEQHKALHQSLFGEIFASNLFNGDKVEDRLFDHYLGHLDKVDCSSCDSYREVLRTERATGSGDRSPQSMHARLVRRA